MLIKHADPLVEGTLVRRFFRFLCDIKLADGNTITAMCANTGTMKSCCEPGRPVILRDSQKSSRKYRHTWSLIHMGDCWVNVDTSLPNSTVRKFVEAGLVPSLAGYKRVKNEVKYGKEGKSRIDLLLTDRDEDPAPPKKKKGEKAKSPHVKIAPPRAGLKPDCYVEVKNTSMRIGIHSAFPDAVTERGQKHLRELMDVVKQGGRAAMFYFCGRTDTGAFRPADEIDAEYGKLLRQARKTGVEILPYHVECTPDGLKLGKLLPLDF
ncbi:MAG: DNA/RNA nuclease SfsA [Planctomycetes bacterium]|nr:DNA/RNA nuclease SfsA [Planctomycetota bacterium]